MPERKGTYVFDMDGTICTQTEGGGAYHRALPRQEVIDRINRLWLDGWEIVIHTARGMKTCNGNGQLAEQAFRPVTEIWLKENRVMYDRLIFGKPAADKYVDDKAENVRDFESRPL